MSADEIGSVVPLDLRRKPALTTARLAATGSATGTYPVLCAGCRHFRPAGSTILSAEPACGAAVSAGSDFQSYFQSRRLLLRARNSTSCEFWLDSGSPA